MRPAFRPAWVISARIAWRVSSADWVPVGSHPTRIAIYLHSLQVGGLPGGGQGRGARTAGGDAQAQGRGAPGHQEAGDSGRDRVQGAVETEAVEGDGAVQDVDRQDVGGRERHVELQESAGVLPG